MEKIIAITGTTATGKTEISIKLAETLNGEIISADSMMVYKYMDIGTAKPSLEERQGIPHYVIDVVYPNENFSVQDFLNIANKKIREIQSKGKTPIVVGGTWLYIQALLYGLSKAPPADIKIREELYKESKETLYKKLLEVDPVYAKKIHINDKKRTVRALEVYYLTGKPFSSFHSWNKPLYDFIGFVFSREKHQIMERIEKRVEKMFELGLVDEVKFLIEKGFKNSLTAMQAIGYKEIIPYIEGKISLEESKKQIIKNTKN
ncbi:MAG TPA: tRNA (adenosine(37)-N6)-dimethylallyltransferase MiaA, partial [Hydrogenothermaceae bacterium]|nr:tRNA (adenosine(37)-N6)-dimethylallyltransferase MiaA [Hydrogenothermaceae bacterium]